MNTKKAGRPKAARRMLIFRCDFSVRFRYRIRDRRRGENRTWSEFRRHRCQRVLRHGASFRGDRGGIFDGDGLRLIDDRLVVNEQGVNLAGQFVHSMFDTVDDTADETRRELG